MIHRLLETVSSKFTSDQEYFNLMKSGWVIERILSLQFKTIQYSPLKAASYLPTPLLLQMKEKSGCLLNIKNNIVTKDNDHNRCMEFSILAHDSIGGLKDKNRSNHWKDFNMYKFPEIRNKVNWDSIEFPIQFSKFDSIMEIFHKNNPTIGLTVIGYHEPEEFAKNVTNEKISLLNQSDWKMYKQKQMRILKHCFPMYMYEGSKRDIEIDLLLLISPDHNTSHFCLIRNLTSFLRLSKTHNIICRACLSQFHSTASFSTHSLYCTKKSASVFFPKAKALKFENYKQTLRVPFCYYMDTESYLGVPEKTSESYRILQHHSPCAFSFICVDHDGKKVGGKTYVQVEENENVIQVFLHDLLDDVVKRMDTLVEYQKIAASKMDVSKLNFADILAKKDKRFQECGFCKRTFTQADYLYKKIVAHHSHIPPYSLECLACDSHNLHASLPFLFNVVIHGGSNYDFAFLVQNLHLLGVSNITIIPKSSQKFVAIFCNIKRGEQVGQIRFIDSFNFLSTSLANLAEILYDNGQGRDKFKLIFDEFSAEINKGIAPDDLLHKSMFPYQLLKNYECLTITDFHDSEHFHNDLTDCAANLNDLERAKRLWANMNITSLRQLVSFYCKLDTLILCCAFEAFRNVLYKSFGLDALHFVSLPGFSYASALRSVTGKLEYITDITMYDFLCKSKRGGFASIGSLKYCESNNPFLPHSLYNPEKPNSFIQCLDVTSLYAYAMKQPLASHSFRFLTSAEIDDIQQSGIQKFVENLDIYGEKGYFFEISCYIPDHLHAYFDDLPPVYENKFISMDMLSSLQRDFFESLGASSQVFKTKRLIADLTPKESYVVHSRLLKLFCELGVKVTTLRNAVVFQQSCFLSPFIDTAIELRKAAKTKFESDVMKKISNATYGRSLLQKEQMKSVKLVTDTDKAIFYANQALFDDVIQINKDLLAIIMKKRSVLLNSPVQWGLSILDIAKEHFLRYFYKILKPSFPDSLSLITTDTDGMTIYVECPNFYEFLWKNKQHHDLSGIDPNDPILGKYFDDTNKGIPGMMKLELSQAVIHKACSVKSKMYGLQFYTRKRDDKGKYYFENISENKKLKGVPRAAADKQTSFEQFVECLYVPIQYYAVFKQIRSFNHELYTIELRKKSVSGLCIKRYNVSPIHTKAFGNVELEFVKGI